MVDIKAMRQLLSHGCRCLCKSYPRAPADDPVPLVLNRCRPVGAPEVRRQRAVANGILLSDDRVIYFTSNKASFCLVPHTSVFPTTKNPRSLEIDYSGVWQQGTVEYDVVRARDLGTGAVRRCFFGWLDVSEPGDVSCTRRLRPVAALPVRVACCCV
jgi:hypothetical protein